MNTGKPALRSQRVGHSKEPGSVTRNTNLDCKSYSINRSIFIYGSLDVQKLTGMKPIIHVLVYSLYMNIPQSICKSGDYM